MKRTPSGHTNGGSPAIEDALSSADRALAAADPPRLQAWDEQGLTLQQIRLMYLVLHHAGRPCVTELANALGVHPATITGHTDRLLRQRLVRRLVDTADHRVKRIVLTARGRALLGAGPRTAAAGIHDALSQMGNRDAGELKRLLDRASAGLSAENRPAAAARPQRLRPLQQRRRSS